MARIPVLYLGKQVWHPWQPIQYLVNQGEDTIVFNPAQHLILCLDKKHSKAGTVIPEELLELMEAK